MVTSRHTAVTEMKYGWGREELCQQDGEGQQKGYFVHLKNQEGLQVNGDRKQSGSSTLSTQEKTLPPGEAMATSNVGIAASPRGGESKQVPGWVPGRCTWILLWTQKECEGGAVEPWVGDCEETASGRRSFVDILKERARRSKDYRRPGLEPANFTIEFLAVFESQLLSGQLGNTWKMSCVGSLCHVAKLILFLVLRAGLTGPVAQKTATIYYIMVSHRMWSCPSSSSPWTGCRK